MEARPSAHQSPMRLPCGRGVSFLSAPLLLQTYGKMQYHKAAVLLQCRRQGPTAVAANAIELQQRRQCPTRPSTLLLQTYLKGQCREAAILLECRRQGPSAVVADAIALQQRRQCPARPSAAAAADVRQGTVS